MIKFVRKSCMDEGMVFISFSRGIVGDVEELIVEVLKVANAVFVKAFLPYLPFVLVADCEGESTFDELGGFFNRFGRSEKNMKVVRHDDETVEEVAGLFSVSEEGGEKDFSVCGPLEEADAVVCDGGEGVGLRLEAHLGKAYLRG
jgi:hypothetical protein